MAVQNLKKNARSTSDPHSILVRRIDNLGDLIMTLPVFRALQRAYPKAEITAMAHLPQWGLLYKYADHFLAPLPSSEMAPLKRKYDLVVDVQLVAPRGYKAHVIGQKKQLYISGFTRRGRAQLSQHFLDGLSNHGIDYSRYRPKVYLKSDIYRQAQWWLAEQEIKPDSHLIVGMNAGSKFAYKRWPKERFLRTARWLIKAYDARIVIFSRDGRCRLSRYLANSLPESKACWFYGQPVEVAAAVLKQCDLMIGNDSGTGHLASAVGTPTVTIFGPTSPEVWRPAGDDSVLVRTTKTDCIGCGYDQARRCKDRICLSSISSGAVADGVLLCLGRNVGWDKKPVLDKIQTAPPLIRERTSAGTLLTNLWTPRPLLVREGYKHVSHLLRYLDKTNSIESCLARFPNDGHLINLLALHRITIPERVTTPNALL